MSCTNGWKITGYYLPESSDYSGVSENVIIGGSTFALSKAFLTDVKMEGWGLITGNRYLGWVGGHWSLADEPLNAVGTALIKGSLAVDRTLIPLGTKVTIPSAPSPWDKQEFIADDTGGAINGKHVDIFCGAGKKSLPETNRVSSDGYTGVVCF